MVAIKPEIVEYVRSFVRDDHETNDRIEAQLNEEGWGDDFPSFLSAVFFYTVDRHFDGIRDDGAIAKFVRELRAENDDAEPEIDSRAAEAAITSVLDPAADLQLSPEKLGQIQTFVIYKSLSEANLSDHDLDSLLEQAARLADS